MLNEIKVEPVKNGYVVTVLTEMGQLEPQRFVFKTMYDVMTKVNEVLTADYARKDRESQSS